MPRPGQVLGLVGTNGIGKSTAVKVLAGKLKPNLGRFTVSHTLVQDPVANTAFLLPHELQELSKESARGCD